MAADLETDELETKLVLDGIYARYGYDFRGYAPDSIKRRLQSALAKSDAPHLGELLHRVLVDPDVFQTLLGDLTVQVSEMFRDPGVYALLRERVLPILRTYPQIKVWHAGCAAGEEVYTTAILFLEENLYDRTQIYATDISAAAVEQARDGIYPETDVAKFEKNYADSGCTGEFRSYYSHAYGRIAMRETLRRNIVFFQHDLVSDHALGEMHLVFCRNVLIYFGTELRERVLGVFASGLRRGGFLCLGGSESLPSGAKAAFEEFASVERVYRRKQDPVSQGDARNSE